MPEMAETPRQKTGRSARRQSGLGRAAYEMYLAEGFLDCTVVAAKQRSSSARTMARVAEVERQPVAMGVDLWVQVEWMPWM